MSPDGVFADHRCQAGEHALRMSGTRVRFGSRILRPEVSNFARRAWDADFARSGARFFEDKCMEQKR